MGTMGAPMAGHLLKAGHSVTVWNRTAAKSAPLADAGAKIAPDLASLAADCDVVFLCVNRSRDVRACLDAMLPTARPGTLFVDHSTISPTAAKELHDALRGAGHRFVDAPVTGGSLGAQKGQLTIFLGGSQEDVDAALPLVTAYAKRAERVGEGGAGQMAKMANQIAVGAALQGLCEALSFAHKAGLDLEQIRALIAGGSGGSWAFENYGPKILNGDYAPGFSVKNQRKDFGYCADAARAIDAAIPSTLLTDKLLARLEERGDGELTTAVLYEEMLRMGADD